MWWPASQTYRWQWQDARGTGRCTSNPKEVLQWVTYFFNNQTSQRRLNRKTVQFMESHCIVECRAILNKIKGNRTVLDAMKKSGIYIRSREKGGASTKLYVGFIVGSNPGMSRRVNMESALMNVLEDQVKDPEFFIDSGMINEFNLIMKEVFGACIHQQIGNNKDLYTPWRTDKPRQNLPLSF